MGNLPKITAILIKLLIAFLLTTFILIITILSISKFDFNSMGFAVSLLITPVLGFYNMIFLLLLYIFKINQRILFEIKFLISEILLFYTIYYSLQIFLDYILFKYRLFMYVPFIFTFTIMLFILFITKQINSTKN